MAEQETPVTVRELLTGYQHFNRWESTEQLRELANLSITDSLTQFFELYNLAEDLAPGAEQIFIEQNKAHWATLRAKLQRLTNIRRYAKEAR